MSKAEECPVCGKHSYFCSRGIYDKEEWGQGAKITPDEYHCTQCGFTYSEDCRPEHSEENAVKLYKVAMNKKRSEYEKSLSKP